MAEKNCSKCGILKPPSEFNKERGKLRAYCKSCHAASVSKWVSENLERRREYQRIYMRQRRALIPPKPRRKSPFSPEEKEMKMREYRRKWEIKNAHKVNQKTRRYQISKLSAVPKWASKEAMEELYAEARKLTRLTGVKHEVDHVVPIQSPIVCGLHCEANLQVIPKSQNVAKLNRSWPDMP